MSKKKASSTMTLKDFHGGSIPSDLPLPSAPGVVVRPSDRAIPNAWGNPMPIPSGGGGSSRSDQYQNQSQYYQRPRPGSSGANNRNHYDGRSSFFSHPPHIGRNFDEDERKPLDGVSLPRRTVSDDILPSSRSPKPPPQSPPRFSGRSTIQQSAVNPPNAWGTRKDVADPNVHSSSTSTSTSTWSGGPNAVSRFAQASALEKVSSGRWQSKPPVIHQPQPHPQPEVEVITYDDDAAAADVDYVPNKLFNGTHLTYEKLDFEDNLVPSSKLSPVVYPESRDRNFSFHHDTTTTISPEPKLGGSHIPTPLLEAVERPKIKLLPRSRPLETSEPPIVDFKQCNQHEYQLPSNSAHVEAVNESFANEVSFRPGSAGSDGSRKAVERPRLNLKPRSQPLEQSHGIVEKERKLLFGGARPRELVLKERGVDEVFINNLDAVQPPNRINDDHAKIEIKHDPVVSTPVYGDRPENFLHDQKAGKYMERRDQRADSDRPEQRGSWRNEKWRNSREPEKQQQLLERRPEPDTWRKPVEQPNPSPSSSDAGGVRYVKAASALELAQAFSGSNSGPRTADRLSGRNQVPFSRLTDTREFYSSSSPRRQINGY